MARLDEEEWAEAVANSAYEWFQLNGLNMDQFNQDQAQVNSVQDQLARYQVTPEQQKLTTDHLDVIKAAVYKGLFDWAERAFTEICPDCEKAGVVATFDSGEAKWMCRKDCGWYGEKHEVIRKGRNHPLYRR